MDRMENLTTYIDEQLRNNFASNKLKYQITDNLDFIVQISQRKEKSNKKKNNFKKNDN